VMVNPVITQLNYEVTQQRITVSDKFSYVSKNFIKKLHLYYLFDKNELTKIQKILIKNPQTKLFEDKILFMKRYYVLINEMPDYN